MLYCNPLPYLPTWYNRRCNFSGNFHIQRLGSFQHKAKDQIPLNLGKKGEGGSIEDERFESSTNDIQKLWTCWCDGSGLILNWIMRGHSLHVALMSGEAGQRWGEGEEGRRRGESHYVQVWGGGWVFPSDAAVEPFKSDSEERGKDNKGTGTDGWKPGVERWVFNKGGREARTGRWDNHRLEKQKVLNTTPQAEITTEVFYMLLAICEISFFLHFLLWTNSQSVAQFS